MGTDRLAVLMLPLMAALISGLTETTGFHVAYKATERGAGIVTLAPWRQRVTAAIAGVGNAWRAWFVGFWTSRHLQIGAAAVAIGLSVAYPAQAEQWAGVGLVAGHINVDALKRDWTTKKERAASLFEKHTKAAQAHEEKVVAMDGKETVVKGRLLTDEEKTEVKAAIDDASKLKAQIERAEGDESMRVQIEAFNASVSKHQIDEGAKRQGPAVLKTLGQLYVDTDDYKASRAKAALRATGWASDGVELHATTLDTGSGSGASLIVTDYRPGILPLLFKRLTTEDLLASGTTDSNSITYMRETSFTNAAAAVAEGAPKPESTLVFDQVTDLVKKIAHWLPVTDEMLEDVAQIRSYIDARLRLGLDIAVEDQLLNGSGTGANIQGLLNRSGLTAAEVRAGAVTNAEAIFVEMMKIFNASFVMPTGTVMNPANWQTTQLSKDGDGRYYGSGPFAGPQPPTLWGLPVAVTPSIVANTALTGAFSSAAQVFTKGGVRVEASNSHQDFFARNLTAIRAEVRKALAVYRTSAFGKITSLT